MLLIAARRFAPRSDSAFTGLIRSFYTLKWDERLETEFDVCGSVSVPAERLWGAQTHRWLINNKIKDEPERIPEAIIRAFAVIKKCAAKVNMEYGLDKKIARAIMKAADDVAVGELIDHFPLVIWQKGNETQINMNANEVIANRTAERLGDKSGEKFVHPIDHVNMSQSSNDIFPTF